MNIQDTLINQIGPVVIAGVIAVLGVTIKAVGNVIIDLIQKKKEEVEQKLEIGKHQQELQTAKEVWGMIDEQHRITGKVEDLIKSKANDFDKLLLSKIPYLTNDEVQNLRQTIAGEINQGKGLLNMDSFKQQVLAIQKENEQLKAEKQALQDKLNKFSEAVSQVEAPEQNKSNEIKINETNPLNEQMKL